MTLLFLDRGAIISSITEAVSETLNGGLQRLELGFASKIGLEMRAELARFIYKLSTRNSHTTLGKLIISYQRYHLFSTFSPPSKAWPRIALTVSKT